MRRNSFVMLLSVLMICSVVFVFTPQSSNAQSGTQVGGILWDNTTWTKVNSPYTITSTIQIPSNVTLTIEAGVSIQTISSVTNMFLLAGNLVAHGTPDEMITFDGDGHSDFFNQHSLTGTSNNATLNMDFCILRNGGAIWYSSNSVAGYFNLTHSFIYRTQGVPYLLPYAQSEIPHSQNMLVCYNVFANSAGFTNINLYYTDLNISNNLFINNIGPIIKSGGHYGGTLEVHNNSFLSNTGDTLVLWPGVGRAFMNATQNYWGTTNTTMINSLIYDKNDDITCADFIPYLPLLTAPDPNTPVCVIANAGNDGSINPNGTIPINYGDDKTFSIVPNLGYHTLDVLVNGSSVGAVNSYTLQNLQGVTTISATFAANPTPTITPTTTPTINPTQQPTSTPTQTITEPSPTPTVPEFPALFAVTMLVLMTILALITKNGKIIKNRYCKIKGLSTKPKSFSLIAFFQKSFKCLLF